MTVWSLKTIYHNYTNMVPQDQLLYLQEYGLAGPYIVSKDYISALYEYGLRISYIIVPIWSPRTTYSKYPIMVSEDHIL